MTKQFDGLYLLISLEKKIDNKSVKFIKIIN